MLHAGYLVKEENVNLKLKPNATILRREYSHIFLYFKYSYLKLVYIVNYYGLFLSIDQTNNLLWLITYWSVKSIKEGNMTEFLNKKI